MVYVLSSNGAPLMPTERHGKVRRMLKSGQARVVCTPLSDYYLTTIDFYTLHYFASFCVVCYIIRNSVNDGNNRKTFAKWGEMRHLRRIFIVIKILFIWHG